MKLFEDLSENFCLLSKMFGNSFLLLLPCYNSFCEIIAEISFEIIALYTSYKILKKHKLHSQSLRDLK